MATVLVVDDYAGIRESVRAALDIEGHAVRMARNGAEALEALEKGGIDVILLDVQMPVMDGIAFAERYHETPPPHVPIILFSAIEPADRMRVAARTGAVGILTKPFVIDDLFNLVAMAAAQSEGTHHVVA